MDTKHDIEKWIELFNEQPIQTPQAMFKCILDNLDGYFNEYQDYEQGEVKDADSIVLMTACQAVSRWARRKISEKA